ncbi:MAG: carbohydrate porin [Alphaproteobacteria bacterium]|jgi:porin
MALSGYFTKQKPSIRARATVAGRCPAVPTRQSIRTAWLVALCGAALLAGSGNATAQSPSPPADAPAPKQRVAAVSGNPAASDSAVGGTGWLGRTLGLRDEWGVKVGGVWLADTNVVVAGGVQPGGWTNNQALILGLGIDAEKLVDWRGASFGFQFLQFNGGETNEQAGSIPGYNGIVGHLPLNRTEFLEAWYLQEMKKDVLRMRIGRTLPTNDFGNVLRPVTLADDSQNIPSVSGLLWSPIFVNASMIGAMMGYYNPANGVTVNFTPTSSFYVNLGAYDGNRARGIQTGLHPPMFNGYWFNIGEIGVNWLLGEGDHPGQFAVGMWRQTGVLSFKGITENGTGGFYLFGSQRVAYGVNSSVPKSSVSVFYQVGANASQTLPISQYYSAGITGFGLIGSREWDSIGFGVGLSRMNQNLFTQPSELMFQIYYQAHLFATTFLQPTVTYIPTPGISATTPGALTTTLRLTVLF